LKKLANPPPLSLSTCWDKGKWHFDAASFPKHLARSAGYTHIVAALHFLDLQGQLTASGRQVLTHPDEEIALLSEQIKPGARAFLDRSYEAYLGEMRGYRQPPPIHVLEDAWKKYTADFDLSKKPLVNAYQKLLLKHAYDRSANALLQALDSTPGLPGHIRNALQDVPLADRPLIESAVAAYESDAISLASSWPNSESLLHALRYLDPRRHALSRLRAAIVLSRRLRESSTGVRQLAALAYAVNLGATAEADAAWRSLTKSEREMLARSVNLLFTSGQETHLALCSMRAVGNVESLKCIEQSVGDQREGIVEFLDGRREPAWESVRREAREAILRRQIQD
jgi:hypothetical protein